MRFLVAILYRGMSEIFTYFLIFFAFIVFNINMLRYGMLFA